MGSQKHDPMVISMIMLNSPQLPRIEDIVSAYTRMWSETPRFKSPKQENDILTFDCKAGLCAIALMPAPIPWNNIEGPCSTAWYWAEAEEVLKPHRSHIIITMQQRTDRVSIALAVTKLTATVASLLMAPGIYWGDGTLVHSTESFLQQAKVMSREYLPLYLWVDFRVNRNDDNSLTLFTTGLSAFDLMEIEVVHSLLQPDLLIDKAFNIAHYLLDNGPVLKDGDTIGVSESERISVRHQQSVWPSRSLVYRIQC